ncbi:VWA domain-containing protein [Vibrio sp. FNV 38]|nr:VWA domain-containing protein [Vibrio sp. FNV 38]
MFDWQNWSLLLTQFHFIRPWWLLAFIPASGLLYLQWEKRSKDNWHEHMPTHLKEALTLNHSGWQSQLPLKVLAVSFSISIITCAGPTWQREASPFGEDKAEVVYILDVSSSMVQTDVPPSRLDRSKHKILDILEYRDGGKNALIAYAGSAHIAMPLTQDSAVFAPFLSAIEPNVMPVSGKSVEETIPLLDSLFSNESGGSVILVTDGINASSIDRFANYFQQNDSSLIVLAIGQYQSAASTPSGYEDLKHLARSANGAIVELSVDNADVEQVAYLIDRNMQLHGDSSMPWKDMGYLLLVPVALLTLLWFRKGWLVQWVIVATFILPSLAYSPSINAQEVMKSHSEIHNLIDIDAATSDTTEEIPTPTRLEQMWFDLWLTRDQQGQRLFNQQRYLEAAVQFETPIYRGVAYYYGRDYVQAHAAFMEDNQDLAVYFSGTALARQREYLAARDLLNQLLDKQDLNRDLRLKVINNRDAISAIIEDIERYSESQMNTTDGPEESFEIADNPQTSQGVEETVTQEYLMEETLNANEILGSDELADRWLERIESDPTLFLKNKFFIQLEATQSIAEANNG